MGRQDEPGVLRAAEAPGVVEARDLPQDRRLRGVGEDPRREDATRDHHRHRQGVGPARPRRRRIPDGREVELHAAQCAGPEIRRVQLRRERARHLPRPRHPALQPACADRGHGHRLLRHGRHRGLQLHPRRVPRRAGAALRGGAEGSLRSGPAGQEHPRQRHRRGHLHAPSAPAPTSAARKPRCSNRSKASRASRASSRRSRPTTACTASPPPSTTRRALPRCRPSCARARPGSRAWVRPTPAAR